MPSFTVALVQLAAGVSPREAVLGAAGRGARLVVLPAFAFPAALGAPAPCPEEAVLGPAKALAREAGCHLVPGSALVAGAGGEVEHVSWLLSPRGEVLGRQTQTHPGPPDGWASWGEAPGGCPAREAGPAGAPVAPVRELEVIEAPELGLRFGLLVGPDAWVPEVARILTLRGAEVLVAPLALPGPYSEPRQVAGLWQEIQQTQAFGLEACLVGPWLGRERAGRSAAVGPCELVPDGSGFLARAAGPDRPEVLFATLDDGARRAVVRAYDLYAELNVGLYRRAFPDLYLEPRTGGAVGEEEAGLGPGPGLELGLKERVFRAWLRLGAGRAEVSRAVRSLDLRPAGRARPGAASPAGGGGRRVVRVAALQLECFYARSVREYVLRLGERFREAVAAGADLVAFPEMVTMPLIGLLPGVGEGKAGSAGDAAGGAGGPGGGAAEKGSVPRLADIVRFMDPILRPVYFELFGSLAAAAGVWVMAGSTPLEGADGRVYNLAALFGPDGSLVGWQRKLHLFPTERDEGFVPGRQLRVFETGIGRIALPICMDATYFETYRLAALLGAEIVAAPVANMEEYNYWKLLRGAWPRVQETPVFAVQSTIVGEFLGRPMTGKASVFAPLDLTPRGDGLLDQCPEPVGPGLAVADLDLDALARYRAEVSALPRLNLELIRAYLPEVYAASSAARSAEGTEGTKT
ncbi:MAG: hypothetical protein K6U08_00835 [Firmicutes bacterium]|nr:hypothetical protein [Bacillota bacterium]